LAGNDEDYTHEMDSNEADLQQDMSDIRSSEVRGTTTRAVRQNNRDFNCSPRNSPRNPKAGWLN